METNFMAKDSIEIVQSQSTTNILVEASPLVAEDVSSGETPTTEVATEQKREDGIDTDQTKPPDEANTAESARKVRKSTQASKRRKTDQPAASTIDQNGVVTPT